MSSWLQEKGIPPEKKGVEKQKMGLNYSSPWQKMLLKEKATEEGEEQMMTDLYKVMRFLDVQYVLLLRSLEVKELEKLLLLGKLHW